MRSEPSSRSIGSQLADLQTPNFPGFLWLVTLLFWAAAGACTLCCGLPGSTNVAVNSSTTSPVRPTESGNPASHAETPGVSTRPAPDADAFTFVRIQYDSVGGFGESWYRHEGRDWERWETDYPRGEKNLLFRLDQLTSMQVNEAPIVLRLTDKSLQDYPFIFMSDIGWQILSDLEAKALSHYLECGGFLWIDDFWGDAELSNLASNTRRMGDQWTWRPLPPDHELLHCVYPLERCPQIPARIFFEQSGLNHDPPFVHRQPAGGYAGVQQVHLLGLFDSKERLAAVATHNTDIADGWEREGEDHEFFTRFSIQSYAFTINTITYAMTH